MAQQEAFRRYQSWIQQQRAVTGRTPSESEKRRMLQTFLGQEQVSQESVRRTGLEKERIDTQKEQFATEQERLKTGQVESTRRFNVQAGRAAEESAGRERADKITGIVQTGLLAKELLKEDSIFGGQDVALSPGRVSSLRSTTPAISGFDFSTPEGRAKFLGEEAIEPGSLADVNLIGPRSYLNAGLRTLSLTGLGTALAGPIGTAGGLALGATTSKVVPESRLQNQRFMKAIQNARTLQSIGIPSRLDAPGSAFGPESAISFDDISGIGGDLGAGKFDFGGDFGGGDGGFETGDFTSDLGAIGSELGGDFEGYGLGVDAPDFGGDFGFGDDFGSDFGGFNSDFGSGFDGGGWY